MSLNRIIGAMSGTSMDGLDLCICDYDQDKNGRYSFKILSTKTYSYPASILSDLNQSKNMSVEALLLLDKQLGRFFADCINALLETSKMAPKEIHAIASHGHTIYHQPDKGFTLQIGCGDTIAYRTGIQVINDFRQKDVIAGGQGAPLVPIGDSALFGQRADAFLNIGGFANITIPSESTLAFDICPANLPMNRIVNRMNLPYDDGGKIAKSGTVDTPILAKLNTLDYYALNPPKSLGTEWLDAKFQSILDEIESNEDQLRTLIAHISQQIGMVCKNHQIKSLFITGGGAFNNFLIEEIERETALEIILPTKEEIEFKEAIIFGFLGMRYLQGKTNVLHSVTGAKRDVIGGVLHLP